jgi:hypothetical protein
MADLTQHEHRWIDATHLGQPYELRLCVTCNREERRYMPALVLADGSLVDADWELSREGVGQSL